MSMLFCDMNYINFYTLLYFDPYSPTPALSASVYLQQPRGSSAYSRKGSTNFITRIFVSLLVTELQMRQNDKMFIQNLVYEILYYLQSLFTRGSSSCIAFFSP